ncbi:MAG: sulfatase-like hydrolase/transferase, partial [Actinomycetes bacterium]
MADDEAPDPPRDRGPLRSLLELGVLCSFAIAQPLLDLTGRSPETFVFYRVDGLEVVAFALLIVVVPPVGLWLAITGIAMLSSRAGLVAYAVVAGSLVALIVLQAAKKLSDLRGPVLVGLAAVVAVGALWLIARSAAARTFVTFLTPAPLVFALLFLLASPTGALVRPGQDGTVADGTDRDGPAPPVVMILLDELPLVSLLDSTGQVDERVFPNFARLAGTSHWFRNATAVSGYTQSAVPSILTGRTPEPGVAPSYVEHPDNLFSLLAPDYRIRPFETITQLCDPAMCEEAELREDDRGLGGLFGQTWQVAKALAKPYDDTAPI